MSKITIDRELLEKAIEAMDGVHAGEHHGGIEESIAALRGALAQPQQEPVAHQYQSKDGVWRNFISHSHYEATVEAGSWPIRALYTSPPARKPLTKEEITAISKQVCEGGPEDSIDRFVRAIEAAHGIKEAP